MNMAVEAGTRADATEPSWGARSSRAYRYFVVFFLAIVYTFNFMDRQIMSILQEPIKQDMGLTDTQLGLLTGLAFALFYTSFGIPVAWLADRYKRTSIMAAACGIWSVFTALCGTATNFVQLAIYRVVVGMGEAGGSPPSYSLLSDYFPRTERGTAMALYSLGVPIGSALGIAFGGQIAAMFDWRTAFIAVGLPGILLSVLLLIFIREPVRGGLDPVPAGRTSHEEAGSIPAALSAFAKNPVMLRTALSAGLSAFVGYAILSWNPSFLMRVKGAVMTDVATWYALGLGITGVLGTYIAGDLADRLSLRDQRWYAWIPAIAYALKLPLLALALLTPSWGVAIVAVSLLFLLNMMYLAPALAVVQNAVSPARRTMAGAVLLFVLNLIGLGGGPVYVGWISDATVAEYGDQSLAIGYAALFPMIVLTILAHLWAARAIQRDATMQVRSD